MPNEYEPYNQCQSCGETNEFTQRVEQIEEITVDENGDPTNIEKEDDINILEVQCGNCGEVLSEKDA